MNLRQIEKDKRIVLANEQLSLYVAALKGYKYIDELQDMNEGSFIRWVHLERRKLTNGAFLVRVDIRDDGIYLLMRNSFNKMFSIWADECLIFQKMTAQEKIVLTAMNHVY